MANETVPAKRTVASGRRQIIKSGAAIAAGLALTSIGLGRAKASEQPTSRDVSARMPLSLRGIHYDTGTNYWPGQLSRQIWNRAVVHEEMRVIRDQLHCNAINISGTNIQRLEQAAAAAFSHGLQVWMQPRLFDTTKQDMLTYLGEVATTAESLRQRHGKLVLNVGCELSMFTQGFIEGSNFQERLATLSASPVPPFPEINKALAEHLAAASEIARKHFKGEITYSPIPWEDVDWKLFDIVSANYYRDADNRSTYVKGLRRLWRHGKPVVITEFGCCTFEGAEQRGGMGFDIIDFEQSPPRIREGYVRSEQTRATEIADLLRIYGEEMIDGAFVYQFLSEGEVHSPDPRYDLDMASHAIVKSHGIDLARGTIRWEPKLAFHEIARIYGQS